MSRWADEELVRLDRRIAAIYDYLNIQFTTIDEGRDEWGRLREKYRAIPRETMNDNGKKETE